MSESEPAVYAVRLREDGQVETVPVPGVASAAFQIGRVIEVRHNSGGPIDIYYPTLTIDWRP
jgi:hypothetical protein